MCSFNLVMRSSYYVLFLCALFMCYLYLLFLRAFLLCSLYLLFLCALCIRSFYVPFLGALIMCPFYMPFFCALFICLFYLDWYLVGFWICAEVSGILKKNWLEKLVSPVKRSALIHASILQNFTRRHFFDLNKIFIVFSWEIDIKTWESIGKGLIKKALQKSL